MAGRGAPPKELGERLNPRSKPAHEWKSASGVGWQHGEAPKPPARLTKAARDAWSTWMGAWFAAYWTPEDVPGLRQVVRLYDQVERGEFQRAGELRLQMDTYGMTPKGQQDRRWRPLAEEQERPEPSAGTRYAHLRAVDAG